MELSPLIIEIQNRINNSDNEEREIQINSIDNSSNNQRSNEFIQNENQPFLINLEEIKKKISTSFWKALIFRIIGLIIETGLFIFAIIAMGRNEICIDNLKLCLLLFSIHGLMSIIKEFFFLYKSIQIYKYTENIQDIITN